MELNTAEMFVYLSTIGLLGLDQNNWLQKFSNSHTDISKLLMALDALIRI